MVIVNGLLNKLEEKYGIASNIVKKAKPGDCSHFLYDGAGKIIDSSIDKEKEFGECGHFLYDEVCNVYKGDAMVDCRHFLYDEDCNECKGNAMGHNY